jgi:UDP-3-O-[3-hydroxymyristoyl] N-acetylglucosamine deacetylase
MKKSHMSVHREGNCLGGSFSKLEITSSNEFTFYKHIDSREPVCIPLTIDNIIVKDHLVSFGQKQQVDVVEHFFSALYGLNLFNVRIDVFGHEIPFFDGSSKEFVRSLNEIKKQDFETILKLNKRCQVKENDSYILYEPLEKDEFFIEMELSHPFISTQKIALEINKGNYIKEIAPARTFVFTDEADSRLKNLPPYGIGITKNGIFSCEPLRFHDEFVRHKILDLLGDLYVLQKKLVGKISARNTSHELNLKFVRKCFSKGVKDEKQ